MCSWGWMLHKYCRISVIAPGEQREPKRDWIRGWQGNPVSYLSTCCRIITPSAHLFLIHRLHITHGSCIFSIHQRIWQNQFWHNLMGLTNMGQHAGYEHFSFVSQLVLFSFAGRLVSLRDSIKFLKSFYLWQTQKKMPKSVGAKHPE